MVELPESWKVPITVRVTRAGMDRLRAEAARRSRMPDAPPSYCTVSAVLREAMARGMEQMEAERRQEDA